MSDPMIMKVKLEDGGRVTVHFREKKGLDEKNIEFKSSEKPDPDLIGALQALHEGVRDICELPEWWCKDKLKVTGVTWSFSEGTQVRGACLIAQAAISTAQAPLNLVTPHLPFEQYNEDGQAPLMPDAIQAQLDRLEIEALAYVSGEKRAQLSLALVA